MGVGKAVTRKLNRSYSLPSTLEDKQVCFFEFFIFSPWTLALQSGNSVLAILGPEKKSDFAFVLS